MNRGSLTLALFAAATIVGSAVLFPRLDVVSGSSQKKKETPGMDSKVGPKIEKVVKTDDEWRRILTPEQFYVTRQKGTERPFTGPYHNSKEKGTYVCVACGLELFASDTKFDSGTGWPSFWAPLNKTNVHEERDRTQGMERVEVLCSRCDAHLGHVFDDGPKPTGLRYCMNSASLKLVKRP